MCPCDGWQVKRDAGKWKFMTLGRVSLITWLDVSHPLVLALVLACSMQGNGKRVLRALGLSCKHSGCAERASASASLCGV